MVNRLGNSYTAIDLAFVVPTYNRPEKVRKLLESIASQGCRFCQVVVVGSGQNVEDVVTRFADRLPVCYYHSVESGQIAQRNLGIANLSNQAKLVAFLDDDLVLESGAVASLLSFWNTVETDTAGVGFNITNEPTFEPSWIRSLFLLGSHQQGRVLVSGFAVPLTNVPESRRTQWLGGGYTVWRRDIVEAFPQSKLETRWAIGEDVRYSYSIGKQYPLYICSEADVRHEHVADQAPSETVLRFRGRKWAVAQLVFAKMYVELSVVAALWMVFGSLLLSCYAGMRGIEGAKESAVGKLQGIYKFLNGLIRRKNLQQLLADSKGK